jgi:hypothetical protein
MYDYDWHRPDQAKGVGFTCGFCGRDAAPSKMYQDVHQRAFIYICPACTQPTFIGHGVQVPSVRMGREINGITSTDIATLYNEARDCTSAGAFNATVMICRKILMNLAVQHGAEENKNFLHYVDHLTNQGFVPPQGRKWVDAIRTKGNEANHEIALMDIKDAQLILHFTEALLRFNYEMPHIFENHSKP